MYKHYDERVPHTSAPTTRIITSLNRKGGVGKRHLCWLTASVCEERSKRCLVLDLDPQANITSSLFPHEDGGPTIEVMFDQSREPDPEQLVRRTTFANIDIIPGSLRLEHFNVSDQACWEAHDLHLSLVDALSDLGQRYDYVLLDCPPSLSLVSYAAMCASDFVMIPMEAARWGALGTQHIVAATSHIQSRWNARLQLLGYVVSRYKATRASNLLLPVHIFAAGHRLTPHMACRMATVLLRDVPGYRRPAVIRPGLVPRAESRRKATLSQAQRPLLAF